MSHTRADATSSGAGRSGSPERAIFVHDAGRLIPTGLARGPWYPDTQHGSAMLGLLARAVDRHPCDRPMQITRFTADMMRAAPLRPVETACRTIRSGKSLEILEATLDADGETFARATAVRFRLAPVDVGSATSRYGSSVLDRPGDEASRGLPELPGAGDDAFHHALEMRPPRGVETPSMWFRMKCPLVAGEPLSAFVRTAIIADWTYSVPHLHGMMAAGAYLERGFSAINPDTSINLHRPMRGEWLGLDGHAHYGEDGAGTALAFLHDDQGPIGHASQCILIRTADKRPVVVGELQGTPRRHPRSA